MTDITDELRAARASEWLRRDDANPRFVVVGVPASSGTPDAPDTWETPAAARRMLHRFSTYDSAADVDLSGLSAADWGDWLVAHLRLREMVEFVQTSTASLGARPTYAFIGGDALVTLPLATHLPHADVDRTGVILLSAHRRALPRTERPTAASLTRSLVAQGVEGDRIVHLGVQPFADTVDEVRWCEDQGIRAATTAMIEEHGIARVVEEAIAYLEPVVDTIHLSIDLGVLDRAHAPGAPGARPGGLSPTDLATAARTAGAHPAVRSVDLVDVDMGRDVGETTVMNLTAALLSFASGVASR